MTTRAQMVVIEDDAEMPDVDLPKRPTKGRVKMSPKTEFILAWRRQVARDGDLSDRGRRLAMILDQHLWKHSELEGRYYAEKSQTWLAGEVNISRTTIQKAFIDLLELGHLEAVIRKGRGKENQYLPVLKPEKKPLNPIEETDPVACEPIFDPGEATAAAVELITETTKAEIESLTKVYDREIRDLHDNTGNADLYHMIDLFKAFQSAFPPGCHAFDERDAEVDFLELVGHGFPPIVLYKNALKHVRQARESGREIMSVDDWLTEMLAETRYL